MKLKISYLFILLLTFFILSCSNDDDGGNNATDIYIVTGLVAKSSNFSEGFLLGNPNTRMPLNFTSTSIIAYPNPVINALSIELTQTEEVISDIYLIEAVSKKNSFQNVDFEELLTNTTYSIEEVSEASLISFNNLSSNNITLNLEGYNTGYYRVFIKTDSNLYWDNIYIDNEGVDITEFFDSWE